MSNSEFVTFARPEIGAEEIAEVIDTLMRGWITTGPKARQFEQEFAQFIGGGVEAIAVNSATAGLHLAAEAAGIGPSDEVIVPTHTFTATAEIVRYVGADPVFVDIDANTYCMSVDATKRAVTGRTRALMPVHYAGYPCQIDELTRLARDSNLRIIEDAAHALPTLLNGNLIGSLNTDATVFSFYATKSITTGEGGMLVTRNSHIAERARVMRLHGIDRDAFDRYGAKSPSWYYEVIAPGYKYNMTDIAAAIGIHQLRKVMRFHGRRREIADRYDEQLSKLPLWLPPRPPVASSHAWHLYVIRLRSDLPISRDQVIEELFRRGIGCSVHYVPLHRQPYWRERYDLTPDSFPVSEELYKSGISLPIYSRMTDADQTRVISALQQVLRSC